MKITLGQFVENLTEPKHDWRMKLQQLHKIIHQMLVVIRSGVRVSGVAGTWELISAETVHSASHVSHVATCRPRASWLGSEKMKQFFMTEEIVSQGMLPQPKTSNFLDHWRHQRIFENQQWMINLSKSKRVLKGYLKVIYYSYQLLILKSCSYLVCSINQIAGQSILIVT